MTSAFQKVIENGDGTFSIIFNQPESVRTVLILFFVGVEAAAGIVYALMLMGVNVERTLPLKQAIIRARMEEEAHEKGEEWIPPETRAKLEQEKLDEEAEEAYRKELKARCERKGLDYEEELERHLATVQEKRAKEALKEEKAAAKAAQKKEKAKAKEEARLASMSEEKRASYEERKAKKAAREEAAWEKEKERGEESYRKMKAELARYEAR